MVLPQTETISTLHHVMQRPVVPQKKYLLHPYLSLSKRQIIIINLGQKLFSKNNFSRCLIPSPTSYQVRFYLTIKFFGVRPTKISFRFLVSALKPASNLHVRILDFLFFFAMKRPIAAKIAGSVGILMCEFFT